MTAPRRVVFVNRFFFPDEAATSQILSDLAFAAASGGREVLVVTSAVGYREDEPLPRREEVRGIDIRRVWTPARGRMSLFRRAMQYLAFYAGATWRLVWLLRRGDVVVALTDPPALSVPIAFAAGVKRALLVNWLQDVFPEVATQLGVRIPGARLLTVLRDWSLRRAAVNVVVSPSMGRHVETAGVDSARVEVIPNWADDESIHPIQPDSTPLRAEWGLEGRFVAEYSGNMGRAHEFETILDAAEQLQREPDVAFLFIGGGPAAPWVRQRVEQKGLTNVLFKPPQPRAGLVEALAVGDVHLVCLRPALEGLVVPSKYYGVLAAGRPVIYVGGRASDIAREVLDRQCGRVVSPGDAPSLAAAILSLRDCASERARLGSNARNLLDERYTRRAALDRWQGLLAALDAHS